MPATAQAAAYRVLQERCTNALKHAVGLHQISLTLSWEDDALELTVTDDGAVLPGEIVAGHGITGMRERLALFGGRAEAGPQRTGGWQVRATLPYDSVHA